MGASSPKSAASHSSTWSPSQHNKPRRSDDSPRGDAVHAATHSQAAKLPSPSSRRPSTTRLKVGESLQPVRCTAQQLLHLEGVLDLNITCTKDSFEGDTGHYWHVRDRDKAREKENKKGHGNTSHSRKDQGASKTSRRSSAQVSCHSCNRLNSPEWRLGPDGPGTLCNVCGLIYAKRETHRRERR